MGISKRTNAKDGPPGRRRGGSLPASLLRPFMPYGRGKAWGGSDQKIDFLPS
jgi:hypothetical protein